MAAGVTPGMREAWPSERGRTSASRSRISVERPGHGARSRGRRGSVRCSSLLEPRDVVEHASDVALVFRATSTWRATARSVDRVRVQPAGRRRRSISGPAEQLEQRRAADPRAARGAGSPPRPARAGARPPRGARARPGPGGSRAGVRRRSRVVLAQQQSVLRARREHPVRLERPLGHQVVHEHRHVALRTIGQERLAPAAPPQAALMPAHRPRAAASS